MKGIHVQTVPKAWSDHGRNLIGGNMISSIGGGLIKMPNKEFGSEVVRHIFGIKPQNHAQLASYPYTYQGSP